MARSAVRVREFAIRLAAGATRWQLARQLLAENLALALAGGALGLLFSRSRTPYPGGVPGRHAGANALDFRFDPSLAVFGLALAAATALCSAPFPFCAPRAQI